jgi:hypothetical protein
MHSGAVFLLKTNKKNTERQFFVADMGFDVQDRREAPPVCWAELRD